MCTCNRSSNTVDIPCVPPVFLQSDGCPCTSRPRPHTLVNTTQDAHAHRIRRFLIVPRGVLMAAVSFECERSHCSMLCFDCRVVYKHASINLMVCGNDEVTRCSIDTGFSYGVCATVYIGMGRRSARTMSRRHIFCIY